MKALWYKMSKHLLWSRAWFKGLFCGELITACKTSLRCITTFRVRLIGKCIGPKYNKDLFIFSWRTKIILHCMSKKIIKGRKQDLISSNMCQTGWTYWWLEPWHHLKEQKLRIWLCLSTEWWCWEGHLLHCLLRRHIYLASLKKKKEKKRVEKDKFEPK